VDVSKDNLMIELTGNVNKIEAFINLISDFGVIEIVRTGITGLSRGEDNSNIF
jgi:acetolactate synthase-1/3 small subunit